MTTTIHLVEAAPDTTRRDRLRETGGCHEGTEECSQCETFVCARCRLRVSWDSGAYDDCSDLCDDCWAAVKDAAWADAIRPLPRRIGEGVIVVGLCALAMLAWAVSGRDER